MKLIKCFFDEVLYLEPNLFKDSRGYFFESYNLKKFNDLVGKDINFVQDNESQSKKSVIRGIHYQKNPYEQGKLVRVLSGSIFDVAVDLRKNSKTFKKHIGVVLSETNKRMLWIPRGFGHGFQALENNTKVIYKTDNCYNKDSELTIPFDDKIININWPLEDPILSIKDMIK